MGLRLTIYSNIENLKSSGNTYVSYDTKEYIELTITHGLGDDELEASIPIGPDHSTYKFSLTDAQFKKEMYQPGEVIATIQANKSLTPANLNSYFRGCKAKLDAEKRTQQGDSYITSWITVAQDYFIYDLVPKYTSDSLYVEMKIYSPDKLMTLHSFCRAYVARRLGEDILKTEAADGYTLPYVKIKDSGKERTSETYTHWTPSLVNNNKEYEHISPIIKVENKLLNKRLHTDTDKDVGNPLKATGTANTDYVYDEYIHPYLVQYNESFYDLLCRTANRWGEFVYFEGSNLILGRDGSSKTISSYTSVSYLNNQYTDSTTINVLQRDINNPINLQGEDPAAAASDAKSTSLLKNSSKLYYKDFVTRDEYMTPVDQYPDGTSFLSSSGDMNAGDDVYGHKVLQSFLTSLKTNLLDWGGKFGIAQRIIANKNSSYEAKKNALYYKKFFTLPKKVSEDKDYATTDLNQLRINAQYKSDSSYCQFGTQSGGLRATDYADVLKKELQAGRDMICIDLGTNYVESIALGDTVQISGGTSDKYVVVKIETQVERSIDETSPYNPIVTYTTHYYIYAIKASAAGVYYPAMLPTGHVRLSGPQTAVIADTFDPMRNSRYRVKYTWQAPIEEASPWLQVTHEMLWNNSGAVWQLKKNIEVLLNYEDGNIERPYIMGVLQNKRDRVPRAAFFNGMNLNTPGDHVIRLSDGYGSGTSAFVNSIHPIAKISHGLNPEFSRYYKKMYGDEAEKDDFEPGRDNKDRYYEGGVEITDHYGIYSIKASTDDRNISIKSPYGDIELNAFTGITISAPNGDVKIEGKNISIEAGNNLSLTSGKNIANGLLGSGAYAAGYNQGKFTEGLNGLATSVAKFAGSVAFSFLDMPLLRHTWEVIFRPVSGIMEIKANRFMKLHSGLTRANANKGLFEDETWTGGATTGAPPVDAWFRENISLYDAWRNMGYRFADQTAWGPNRGLRIGGIYVTQEQDDKTQSHEIGLVTAPGGYNFTSENKDSMDLLNDWLTNFTGAFTSGGGNGVVQQPPQANNQNNVDNHGAYIGSNSGMQLL